MRGINTIYNEDNLVTMKKMPDNFISGIITSPLIIWVKIQITVEKIK